jgi:hypothetical protein
VKLFIVGTDHRLQQSIAPKVGGDGFSALEDDDSVVAFFIS